MPLVETRILIGLSLAMVAMVAINLVFLQKRNGERASVQSLDIEAAIAADARRSGGLTSPGEAGKAQVPSNAGFEGDLVRVVQRELIVRNYAIGAADGVAGLMTRAAILAFEFDHGHPLTAEPSESLLKSILAGAPGSHNDPARMPSGKARDLIATVQASLIKLGYEGAGKDGRLGDATRRAISEFEMDRGLPRSGRVSPTLIKELAKAAGKGRMNKASR